MSQDLSTRIIDKMTNGILGMKLVLLSSSWKLLHNYQWSACKNGGLSIIANGEKTAVISKNYPFILEGSLSLVHNC